MNPIDLATLISFHQNHEKAKTTAEQVGWHNTTEQRQRFQVLTEIGNLQQTTVLDAGCGLGDFWDYLLKNNVQPAQYLGVDCLPSYVQKTKVRFDSDPRVSVAVGDLAHDTLPMADYVFASGSLSYPSQTPNFLRKALKNLFLSTRKGLAFNLLRQKDTPQDRFLSTYSPAQVLEYCKTLTEHITLREDYSGDDFTLYLYPETP